jgi:hypothetical protein
MRNEPSVSPSLPMCFTPRKPAYFLRRRCLAPVLALAYVLATIGLPWPASTVARDATPFPCQGHRCGCTSAEQCWSHCCCFTPGQRLAWAAANGVDPPAELVAAVADHDDDPHVAAEKHSGVDQHAPSAHCCCHKPADASGQPASSEPVTPQSAKGKKTERHGFQAFKCHGISTLWVASGAVAPSVAPLTWAFDWTVVGTVPTLRCSLSAVPLLPAVPPPRV